MTKRQLDKLKKEPIYKTYIAYKRQFTKERSHKGANMKAKAMTYRQFKTYMGLESRTLIGKEDIVKQSRINKVTEGSLTSRKRLEKETRYTIWERDAKEAYAGYKAQHEGKKGIMSEKSFIAKYMERKAKDVAYREVMNVKGFTKKQHQRVKAIERDMMEIVGTSIAPSILEQFIMETYGLQMEQADGSTIDISKVTGTRAFLDLFNEWLKMQGYGYSYDRAAIITLDLYGSPN